MGDNSKLHGKMHSLKGPPEKHGVIYHKNLAGG